LLCRLLSLSRHAHTRKMLSFVLLLMNIFVSLCLEMLSAAKAQRQATEQAADELRKQSTRCMNG